MPLSLFFFFVFLSKRGGCPKRRKIRPRLLLFGSLLLKTPKRKKPSKTTFIYTLDWVSAVCLSIFKNVGVFLFGQARKCLPPPFGGTQKSENNNESLVVMTMTILF